VSETVPQPSRFTSQCTVIARMLRDGDGDLEQAQEEALASALRHVQSELPRLLSRRVSVEGEDPEDIAQEALRRFLTAVAAGRVDPDGSPAGYLMTIAMNVVRDSLRGKPNPVPIADFSPAPEADVDQVTQLLDGLASADMVRKALARAHADGDQMILEVVSTWLDFAAQLGSAPPSRAVAEEVGISKSTVANALARFKGYLEEA
jgi:DNA-directed RNA polymerase specialized sigma24 family protein